MPKALNLLNQQFGEYTVIEKLPSKNGKTYWKCVCKNGHEKEVQTTHLRNNTVGKCEKCYGINNPNYSQEKIEKICPLCYKKFYTNIKNRKYCYECSPEQKYGTNNYQWTKQRAIKKQLIEYKGGKCEICGYNKCQGALQFHHLNPEDKSFTISKTNLNLNKYTIEELKKEVDKCILICANCHAEIHYK